MVIWKIKKNQKIINQKKEKNRNNICLKFELIQNFKKIIIQQTIQS